MYSPQLTFEPHSYTPDPQAWLSTLSFPPASSVRVQLGRLGSEAVFVRKLYSRVDKPGVLSAGLVARSVVNSNEGLERWADGWMPHLSLL